MTLYNMNVHFIMYSGHCFMRFSDMEKHDFTVLLRNDLDYNVAWSMTTELVAMEVVNRIFITFSEV